MTKETDSSRRSSESNSSIPVDTELHDSNGADQPPRSRPSEVNQLTAENTILNANTLNQISGEVVECSPQLTIQRDTLNLAQFNSKFASVINSGDNRAINASHTFTPDNVPSLLRPPTPSSSSIFNVASSKASKVTSPAYWVSTFLSFFPFLTWIREYDIANDLAADIICGITVAIFQVPQSMGYCLIAGVPPVHGLYSAFFPPLIYAFLGTSRHSAVGAFAIVSGVMTGHLVTAVTQEIKDDLLKTNPNINFSDPNVFDTDFIHSSVATSTSLWMAIYMLTFGFLHLGVISIFLSPQSISGFQTAASLYVFTSQLSHLTGVKLTSQSGLFALPKCWIEVVMRHQEIHAPTIIISVVMIAILVIFKVFINEWFMKMQRKCCGFSKKSTSKSDRDDTNQLSNTSVDEKVSSEPKSCANPLPLPIELIVVIAMTAASYQFKLEENYHVEVVGEIKQGFPSAAFPPMNVFYRVWLRSIPLALVGYVITLSVGQFYGGKHGYSVDPNQELIALGASNFFGSCFGALPCAASLPRSAVQENTGGRTQLASLVNCGAMLVVLFYVGSLLEQLPNCVLASIISVALIGLIGQVRNVYRLWRVSHGDSLQWLISFLAVIILDVDIGLYAGTAFSLLILVYQSSSPKSYTLGSSVTAAAPDVYVPTKMYPTCRETTGIKIFQFCGPLHFSSRMSFRNSLLTQCNLKNIASLTRKMRQQCDVDGSLPIASTSKSQLITHLILDFSMISYVDSSGIDTLRSLQEQMSGCNIEVYIANCAPHVVSIVTRDSRFMEILKPENVFVSVHDALIHAIQSQRLKLLNRDTTTNTDACAC